LISSVSHSLTFAKFFSAHASSSYFGKFILTYNLLAYFSRFVCIIVLSKLLFVVQEIIDSFVQWCPNLTGGELEYSLF
jgi:hypothetical protein